MSSVLTKILDAFRPETPEAHTQRFLRRLRAAVGAPDDYVLAFVPPQAVDGSGEPIEHAVIIRSRKGTTKGEGRE